MKTVFITGVNRGIGNALVEKFLQEGYFVIGTSRNGSCAIVHQNFLVLPLEVISEESRKACRDAFAKIGKKIDIFINNIGMFDPRDERVVIDADGLRATLEANLIGPVAFTEIMLSFLEKDGHIMNISSRRGSMDYTQDVLYPAYSISKAGINMFTRKLAKRLEDYATVSCIHPGSVRTDMNPDGEISAQESSEDIFALAESRPQTGMFWYKGETMPW